METMLHADYSIQPLRGSRLLAFVALFVGWAFVGEAGTVTGIQGGGFETATDRAFWNTGYYSGGSSLSSGILQNMSRASSGEWYAYVGDYSSTTFSSWGYVYQYLGSGYRFVPGDIQSFDIGFDLNISSDEGITTSYDYMTNSIFYLDATTSAVLYQQDIAWFSNKDKSSGTGSAYYTRKSYHVLMPDLPPCFAYIIWKAKTDSSAYTVFRMDNISVSMNKWTYTVNPSVSGGHGSINPAASTAVESGKDLAFTATPDPTWDVDTWSLDGLAVQTGGTSYTLRNVIAAHNVTVSFKPILYKLNVSITKGQGSWTLNPPGGQYPAGTLVGATATPSPGFQVHEWGGAAYSLNGQATVTMGAREETLYLDFIPLSIAPPTAVDVAHTTPSTLNFTTQPQNDWLTIFEVATALDSSGSAVSPNAAWVPCKIATSSDPSLVLQIQLALGGQCVRSIPYPSLHPPMFLSFPLHGSDYGGASPFTHDVISIMDHDQTYWFVNYPEYGYNNTILTYLGEQFDINALNSAPPHSVKFSGFARAPAFHYTGQRKPGGYETGVLNYDAHPGYDYRCDGNTPVYAAAPGTLVRYGDPMEDVVLKYARNYHGVVLDHGNGFRTVYMHLTNSPLMVTTTDAWVPITGPIQPITTSTVIGWSGHFLRNQDGTINQSIGDHLHFEVWRQSGSSWILVDPYGGYTTDGSQIYDRIWQ